MNSDKLSQKRLSLAIGGMVFVLVVFAWFDSADCQDVTNAAGNRHVALVVDRSGSMEFLVREVVDNINTVIDALEPTDRLSILFFEDPYGVVRFIENQSVSEVTRLSYDDYFPLGGTPLYDAVGIAIDDVVRPTIGNGNSARYGVVIVISDGEENSSIYYSLSDARRSVSSALAQNVSIQFYGMGPAASQEAAALGIPLDDTLQVAESASGLEEAFDDVQRSLDRSRSSSC